MKPISVIILAGGESRRMGSNKAFLEHNGKPFIERILDTFSDFNERIIVANDVSLYQYPLVETLQDTYPDRGPLCGLYTGLKSAKNDTCIVLTVDVPFISSELMSYLATLEDKVDAIVPNVGGYLHPLCAVYRKSALSIIEKAVEEDIRKVRRVLKALSVLEVKEEDLKQFSDPGQCFRNINTPEEYLEAKKYFWQKEHINEQKNLK